MRSALVIFILISILFFCDLRGLNANIDDSIEHFLETHDSEHRPLRREIAKPAMRETDDAHFDKSKEKIMESAEPDDEKMTKIDEKIAAKVAEALKNLNPHINVRYVPEEVKPTNATDCENIANIRAMHEEAMPTNATEMASENKDPVGTEVPVVREESMPTNASENTTEVSRNTTDNEIRIVREESRPTNATENVDEKKLVETDIIRNESMPTNGTENVAVKNKSPGIEALRMEHKGARHTKNAKKVVEQLKRKLRFLRQIITLIDNESVEL